MGPTYGGDAGETLSEEPLLISYPDSRGSNYQPSNQLDVKMYFRYSAGSVLVRAWLRCILKADVRTLVAADQTAWPSICTNHTPPGSLAQKTGFSKRDGHKKEN